MREIFYYAASARRFDAITQPPRPRRARGLHKMFCEVKIMHMPRLEGALSKALSLICFHAFEMPPRADDLFTLPSRRRR